MLNDLLFFISLIISQSLIKSKACLHLLNGNGTACIVQKWNLFVIAMSSVIIDHTN